MLGKLDGWNFCVSLTLILTHKRKKNKVANALSRKVHEMHVASLSTCQPNLRRHIINHIVEDEMYVQIKDKL